MRALSNLPPGISVFDEHINPMDRMTTKQALELINLGHVVYPYPRKGIVSVDGHKQFRITKTTAAAIKRRLTTL